MDLGPSDPSGAGRGLSNPGVTGLGEGNPAPLLLQVGSEQEWQGGEVIGSCDREQAAAPDDVGVRCLAYKTPATSIVFYVDSGAGQCLSSCSTAFRSLEPCQIEVVGVAGSLPIFGIGTAIFALCLPGGSEIVVRIHNCLYSFGEFNLLSMSQMQTNKRNKVNLSLEAPSVRLYSTDEGVRGSGNRKRAFIDVPLTMDDGLYALTLEPVSSEDTRYHSLRIFDLTPPFSGIAEDRRIAQDMDDDGVADGTFSRENYRVGWDSGFLF